MDCQQSSEHRFHTLDVRVFTSTLPLRMPPPSPMTLFYEIHVLSYTVIDVEDEVRHSIDHHRMAIITPGSCWPYGNTIQQCWPRYVCLYRDSLTQSPLISNWSPNRSQSPPTANLHLLPFLLPHFDQGTCYPFKVSALSRFPHIYPGYSYTIGPNTFENSLIRFISNASHSVYVRYFSGRREGWENTRNRRAATSYNVEDVSSFSGLRAWHVKIDFL